MRILTEKEYRRLNERDYYKKLAEILSESNERKIKILMRYSELMDKVIYESKKYFNRVEITRQEMIKNIQEQWE